MTLLSNFLLTILVIFLLGSIQKVVFDTKKFGSKVNDKQYLYMKNSPSMKKLSIDNFTINFLVLFKWTTI